MGLIEESDVRKLLDDKQLVTEIANAVVQDPQGGESLADDIVSALSDELEDAPSLKEAIVDAAMSNEEFKKKIVMKLVVDLND